MSNRTCPPAHKAAEIFPMMSAEEFNGLVADIREHGLLEPIVMVGDEILDGRNRFKACIAAGIAPRTVQWDGKGIPHDFVVSHNLHRRHLNTGERGLIAARLATLKMGDVKSQTSQSVSHGVENQTPPPITISQAAKMMNVSRATVSDGKTVLANASPEEIAAVKRGEVSLDHLAANLRGGPRAERKEHGPKRNPKGDKKRNKSIRLNAQVWRNVRTALVTLENPLGVAVTDPFFRLRGYFLSDYRTRKEPLHSIALCIKATNAAGEGRTINNLTWRSQGNAPEPFPVLSVPAQKAAVA